jgi:hypothetical protein
MQVWEWAAWVRQDAAAAWVIYIVLRYKSTAERPLNAALAGYDKDAYQAVFRSADMPLSRGDLHRALSTSDATDRRIAVLRDAVD